VSWHIPLYDARHYDDNLFPIVVRSTQEGIMAERPYAGVFPVLPTPFTATQDIDMADLLRAVDFLLATSIGGFCILANWSEQFALADDERVHVTEAVLGHVNGRLPVIVTTSHFSPRVTIARSRRAAAAGASMIMVTPPYHGALHPGLDAIADYFRELDAAVSIPIMIQDAPISGVELPVDFLAELVRECSNLQYFKIECARAAGKIRRLLQLAGEHLEGVFDGEEGITLLADLDAGATGTMPSALVPDLLAEVLRLYFEGNRQGAAALYERLLPLLNFENKLGGIQPAKIGLYEGSIIANDRLRAPLPPLEPEFRVALMDLVRRLDPLVLRYARS
jgi:2-keto-3-deoxy-L-arabinonate dehydratase